MCNDQFDIYSGFCCAIALVDLFRLRKKSLKIPWVMALNTTFNNTSVISWWSVLLVEETGVPGKDHRPAESLQTLSHNVVSSTPRHYLIRTHNLHS